jgi:hypothetical protein
MVAPPLELKQLKTYSGTMFFRCSSHQLIRVIYAMLTQRTTFCPQMNS